MSILIDSTDALFSNALEHGRQKVLSMDVQFSIALDLGRHEVLGMLKRTSSWTSVGFGHGCSVRKLIGCTSRQSSQTCQTSQTSQSRQICQSSQTCAEFCYFGGFGYFADCGR